MTDFEKYLNGFFGLGSKSSTDFFKRDFLSRLISYEQQTLTPTQQAQARENINALGLPDPLSPRYTIIGNDAGTDIQSGVCIEEIDNNVRFHQFLCIDSGVTLGSELLQNPNFDTDLAWWSKTAGVYWESGGAKHTPGTIDYIEQYVTCDFDETYRAGVTVSGLTAGSVTVMLGSTSFVVTSNGTFTNGITGNAGSTLFRVTMSSDFNGVVDSMTSKEVGGLRVPLHSSKDHVNNPGNWEIYIGHVGDYGLSVGRNSFYRANTISNLTNFGVGNMPTATDATDSVLLGHNIGGSFAKDLIAIGRDFTPASTYDHLSIQNMLTGTLSTGELYTKAGLTLYNGLVNEYKFPVSAPEINDIMIVTGAKQLGWGKQSSVVGGVYLYLHEEDSDITGYEKLLTTPANSTEQIDSVSVSSGTGELVIDEYVTDALNTTIIQGGTWEFSTYLACSSLVGTTTVTIRCYKRTSGGSETLLFSSPITIDSTSVKLYTTTTVQQDIITDITDRLVFKYVASTTNAAARTVSLYYEGSTHYSHIHTPLSAIVLQYWKETAYRQTYTLDAQNAVVSVPTGYTSGGYKTILGATEYGLQAFSDRVELGVVGSATAKFYNSGQTDLAGGLTLHKGLATEMAFPSTLGIQGRVPYVSASKTMGWLPYGFNEALPSETSVQTITAGGVPAWSALSGWLKADGSVTGATSQAQAFTNGVKSDARNAYYIGSKLMISDYSWGGDNKNVWLGGASNSTVTGVAGHEGNYNNAIGVEALYSLTTGYNNNAIGVSALRSSTTGYNNNAIGVSALYSLTTGTQNNAIGVSSLRSLTTGNNNNAIGVSALYSLTTGNNNNAIGVEALYSLTTGTQNNAIGVAALRSLTTGTQNNAIGVSALYSLTTGYNNNAIGVSALYSLTTGNNNNAIGVEALYSSTTGTQNNAIGVSALRSSTTGYNNNAIGVSALRSSTTGYNNNAIGVSALYSLTTGTQNCAFGYNTGLGVTTGNNNTIIGNNVTGLDSNLSNNIILATGDGGIKGQFNSTIWNFAGGISTPAIKLTTGAVVGKYWSCTNVDGSGEWATAPAGSKWTDGTGFIYRDGAVLIHGTTLTANMFFEVQNGQSRFESPSTGFWNAGIFVGHTTAPAMRVSNDGAGNAINLELTNAATDLYYLSCSDISNTRFSVKKSGLIFSDSLTASTVVYSDASKGIVSLANGTGVLTNNGSGGLSWASVVSSQWSADTYGINYTNSVGIGTSSSNTYKLYVSSSDYSAYIKSTGTGNVAALTLEKNSTAGNFIVGYTETGQVFRVMTDGGYNTAGKSYFIGGIVCKSGSPDCGINSSGAGIFSSVYISGDSYEAIDSSRGGHFTSLRIGSGGGSVVLNSDGSYSPPTLSDSAALNNSIFRGSDHSNKLCYKDSGGTVNELY